MASPYSFKGKPWFNKRNYTNSSPNTTTYDEVYNFEILPVSGYWGFKLYFPLTDELDHEKTIKNIQAFGNVIQRNTGTYPTAEIEKSRAFFVDYSTLIADNVFTTEWEEFKTDITTKTEYCLNCVSLAMHQTLMKHFEQNCEDTQQLKGYCYYIRNIKARLYNYEPILQLKNLKTTYFGKLVCVRGTVMKAGNRQLLCQYLAFQCSSCMGTQVVQQEGGLYTPPTKCLTKMCKAQFNFSPLWTSPNTKTVDWQCLKIQELVGDSECENGRIPRAYECELTEDLLNCCVPGDDVIVMGIIKRRNSPDVVRKGKQALLFNFYIDTVSVINNKNQSQAGQIIFNTMDYYAIKKIHEEPMLFRFLVHSLCPMIYGNEIVKAGLLLALFGGTASTDSKSRFQSHVLMVGDPGLGKSQMLQACTNVAPRGVYVCGKASTTSGLTVTVTKGGSGEYALEAGALVLADQGTCCIDEFDKMSSQHECLLEAMEQQNISIAKAGIICTLPTRTTILSAANPVEGHYNNAKTVAENLRIKSAMLSRFDLVFILLDKHDVELDMLLPEHVLGLHMGPQYRKKLLRTSTSSSSITDSLKDRLKLQAREEIDHLPHTLFRKYIAYAQKYVKPQLSEEAKAVLSEYFLSLRKQCKDGDSAPVTVRQLHSLIRLTQARAKVELREEATKEDALDVVEIMRFCMRDIINNDLKPDNLPKSKNNLKNSSRNQINSLLNMLRNRADVQQSRTFSVDDLRTFCDEAGIRTDKINSTIETLNVQGFLLNKGQGSYQLVSSNLV